MAINKTLLRKVRNHILAEPRRYDQATFHREVSKSVVPCGTQACIAGWAVLLADKQEMKVCDCGETNCMFVVEKNARKVLGLVASQGRKVFGTGSWPKQFQSKHDNAKTYAERARAAADYINWIIKTDSVT